MQLKFPYIGKLLSLILLCVLVIPNANARNSLYEFSIAEALSSPDADAKMDHSIGLYFAGQPHPYVKQTYGTARTNKKTNAFNKTDQFACEWAFLSAVIQMQNRARSLGADSVVNIKSNYKNRPFSSPTTFQCGAGNILAGVALIGEFVRTR